MSSSVAVATVGQSYDSTLTATGGSAPYWWTITEGYLPLGLALDSASGRIDGVPIQTGQFSFTAVVKDSAAIQQQQASQSLTLSVNVPRLAITTPALPSGASGEPYGIQLQATGGVPPYTWSVSSGGLPAGLELNPLTGVISGTPQEEGTFTVTIQVTDSNNPPSYALLRIGAPEGKSRPALSRLDESCLGKPCFRNLTPAVTALFPSPTYIAR